MFMTFSSANELERLLPNNTSQCSFSHLQFAARNWVYWIWTCILCCAIQHLTSLPVDWNEKNRKKKNIITAVSCFRVRFSNQCSGYTTTPLQPWTISVKARLHRRVLSRQLDAISVAVKLQLQNRTCKPDAFFSAICCRDIAGVSNMFETWCNFSATKIAPSCRDKNRLCKRAFSVNSLLWTLTSMT